jgi:hypothetical protein
MVRWIRLKGVHQVKITSFDEEKMVLEDGTELPVLIPFDVSIPLEELNRLYAKACEFVEGLGDAGRDAADPAELGQGWQDKREKEPE